MPWIRPSRSTLITQTQGDLQANVSGSNPWISRSILRAVAIVTAGAQDILHGLLQYVVRQIHLSTCDDAYVEFHNRDLGVPRLVAAAADDGQITIAGTPTTIVASGTVFYREDGWPYETTAGATIGGGGTIAVAAKSSEVGADGNAASGTLTIGSPIAGVTGATITTAFTNGSDLESYDDWRARGLAVKRNPPQGGAYDDYVKWASEVSGVAAVWVRGNSPMAGDVTVHFTMDGDGVAIIPDAGDVAAVSAAIENANVAGYSTRRPVTANKYVAAPTGVAVAIDDLAIVPDTTANREAVEASLAAMLIRANRTRETDGTVSIPLSSFWTAIGGAAALSSFSFSAPAAAVDIDADEAAYLGTVTYA